MNGRDKIAAAAQATKRIDKALVPALDDLSSAIRCGNGAGIYSDVSRVRTALAIASRAIEESRAIAQATEWPTVEDYEQ